MRFLIPFLFCLSCWAQPDPVWKKLLMVPAPVSSIQNPTNISPKMFRWFVSTDVPANVTVSNQWTDRMAPTNWWQMNTTISPTNGPIGIRFTGTQSVTNRTIGYDVGAISVGHSPPDIFFFIFTPDTTAGEEQIFTDADTGNRGPGMNGTSLRYTGQVSGGPHTICAFAAGTTNDVVMVLTSTNTTWYTNGEVCITNTTASVDDFLFGRIGIGSLGNYHGGLFEGGIYSNEFFTVVQTRKLHKYGTNTYHYSP